MSLSENLPVGSVYVVPGGGLPGRLEREAVHLVPDADRCTWFSDTVNFQCVST